MTASTKGAEIIETDFRLLGVLSRLGISGSFGEKTLSELCQQFNLHTDTVLLLCKVYSIPNFKPTTEMLRNCSTADVLSYISSSHAYYLNTAIEEISESIKKLIDPCNERQKLVIHNFFQGYQNELKNHFEFEEGLVLPYVRDLLNGKRVQDFSIDYFEDHHSNIEEKLSDLRNILLKSLPRECDDDLRTKLIAHLFRLGEDLRSHTFIEDNVLVPAVRLLEKPQTRLSKTTYNAEEEENEEELSAREKEILTSVAMGMLNKEIADKHNISINTVITHRKNITKKIGIKTVAGLTVYAILNNLIDINSIE